MPSLRKSTSDLESEQLMEYVAGFMHGEDEKEPSRSLSESPSPSAFNIEIAGIVIPARKFTKSCSKHKYKYVQTNHKGMDEMHDINLEDKKIDSEDNNSEIKNSSDETVNESKKKNHLFAMPFFAKAIVLTFHYFDRLKEDPSTADLCIICYDSFKKGDVLARLKCRHIFHKNCIRIWLANNVICPLCDMND
eukprot:UN07017